MIGMIFHKVLKGEISYIFYKTIGDHVELNNVEIETSKLTFENDSRKICLLQVLEKGPCILFLMYWLNLGLKQLYYLLECGI